MYEELPRNTSSPFARLVDDLVDDDLGLAEVVLQRHRVRVEAAEQEAAIALEARDFFQVMRSVGVELHRIFGRLHVLHFQQLARIGEAPAVERTGEGAFVAVLFPAQHRALVCAGINDRVQFTALVASDNHGLAANPGGVVVVVVGNLAFVRQVHPIALEDVFHLELKQIGVGEDVAAATEYTALLVVLNGGVQQFIQLRGFVDNGGHECSPYACSRRWSTRIGVERFLRRIERQQWYDVAAAFSGYAVADARRRWTTWLSLPWTSGVNSMLNSISLYASAFIPSAVPPVFSTTCGIRSSRVA